MGLITRLCSLYSKDITVSQPLSFFTMLTHLDLLQNIGTCAARLDARLTFKDANNRFTNLFKITKKELRKQKFENFHKGRLNKNQEFKDFLNRTASVFTDDIPLDTLKRVEPIYCRVCLFRDETETDIIFTVQQLSEDSDQLKMLFEATFEAVVIVQDFEIKEANII